MMVDDDKCAVFCVCECTKQKFWFFYRCPGNLRRVTSIQESTQKIRLISGRFPGIFDGFPFDLKEEEKGCRYSGI